MIEKDIMQYLQTKTDVTHLLVEQIKYLIYRLQSGAKMMWIIIEASGGQRRRISATLG